MKYILIVHLFIDIIYIIFLVKLDKYECMTYDKLKWRDHTSVKLVHTEGIRSSLNIMFFSTKGRGK